MPNSINTIAAELHQAAEEISNLMNGLDYQESEGHFLGIINKMRQQRETINILAGKMDREIKGLISTYRKAQP
jgi:hypothetical protein